MEVDRKTLKAFIERDNKHANMSENKSNLGKENEQELGKLQVILLSIGHGAWDRA